MRLSLRPGLRINPSRRRELASLLRMVTAEGVAMAPTLIQLEEEEMVERDDMLPILEVPPVPRSLALLPSTRLLPRLLRLVAV